MQALTDSDIVTLEEIIFTSNPAWFKDQDETVELLAAFA